MRHLLIWITALGALAGAGWLVGTGQDALRARAPMLPVTFAHATHRGVSCIACHHDYLDDSGKGLCFDCHKTDPAVSALVEAQFHELCMGCHVEKQALGEDGGPTRRCADCHTADEAP